MCKQPLFKSNIRKLDKILTKLGKSRTMKGTPIIINNEHDAHLLDTAVRSVRTAICNLEQLK